MIESKNSPHSSDPTPSFLHVVLHGLISLVEIGDAGFTAYVLEMGPEHDYLYGDWLNEDTFPPRITTADPLVAHLVGVSHGNARLNCKLNAVHRLKSAPPINHPSVRAVVHLPKPQSICNALCGQLRKNALAGTLGNLVDNPTHISGVRIFTYTFAPDSPVALITDGDSLWSPELTHLDDANKDVAVLHIYNEPGKELGSSSVHNRKEFNTSASFLGSDLLLIHDTLVVERDEAILKEAETAPKELLDGELVFLYQRPTAVSNLISLARNGAVTDPVGTGGGQVCGGMNGLVG